ncbi:MAG TPA: MerR family transcriptional regulator [Candidatus Limnocylindria bacterium]|nr:MerR family transcriptional regulator [Candidatus Limnocylindria bacterium]
MYSIKEAASRSGVSIPTLRAWERRYGVVQPVRTPSGYRLYDEGAIARLKHMRALVANGWRPREAARRVAETAQLTAVETGQDNGASPADVARQAGEAERLSELFVRAALRYDTAAIEALLDEIFARSSFESAMETVVFPSLERVGLAWEAGELSVAAEHAASQTVFRRVALFYEASARATTAEVVVGLPPGARHDLGSLAFSVAARRLGIGVLFLGADVPVDSWLSVIRDSGADVAVIAVPTAADVAAAVRVVEALREARAGVACLVGGSAADQLPAELDTVALPRSIGEAARTVASMLTGREVG